MSEKEQPSHFGHRQRLRQKFKTNGLDSFLEHEALELLLTYCIARRDTKPLAWVLLKQFGSLSAVLDASAEELMHVKGIGEQTVVFLKVIRAIFKKYSLAKMKETVMIRTPGEVLDYCKASLAGRKEECLEVIYLSVRNTVMGAETISLGSLDRVSISPRKIIERALTAKAAAIILVHNHPSGDPTPSLDDVAMTKDVTRAAALFGITVHDHIIIGRGKHYSLKANGML